MLDIIWWPIPDKVDWDVPLPHRIGKFHEVALWHLQRQPDGALARIPTPLVKQYKQFIAVGEESIGRLEKISHPSPEAQEEQLPPIGEWIQPTISTEILATVAREGNGNGNGNGNSN